MPPNRSNSRLSARRARGFTLVELLVVVVVFGLVAVLLLSVLNHVREKNDRINCGDNLRKISIALRAYAKDNDGVLPAAMTEATHIINNRRLIQRTTWEDRIACDFPDNHPEFPTCRYRQLPGIFALRGSDPAYSGYACNASLSETMVTRKSPAASARKRNSVTAVTDGRQIDFPSLVVEVLEARTGMVALNAPDVMPEVVGGFADNATASLVRSQPPGALRHAGGANYAFVDGHVHWYLPSEILAKPKCDGVHPGMGI